MSNASERTAGTATRVGQPATASASNDSASASVVTVPRTQRQAPPTRRASARPIAVALPGLDALRAACHRRFVLRIASAALSLGLLAVDIPVVHGEPPAGRPRPCALLRDGDRVAWIGDGLVEREQRYGHVELAWLLHFADRRIRVRNLGWTGDTVRGEARSYFGPPAEGFRRLLEHVALAAPTVIVLAYGNNESFSGQAGLRAFVNDYNRLLDALQRHTKRIVLMSPVPVEQVDPPLPDLSHVNKLRKLYTDAVQRLAERRGLCFIDVFHPMLERMAEGDRLTDNGVHLNERGYRALAEVIERAWFGAVRRPPGLTPQLEDRLRELVRRKNEFFFHQYRPQNETYLRGFRKHEQGRNARELPQFAPLIERTEQQIFTLLAASDKLRDERNTAPSSTPSSPSGKRP